MFYLLYERVSVSEDSLAPHLWTYRARITLEHLSQTLQQQSSRTKYPILIEFLKEVHVATGFDGANVITVSLICPWMIELREMNIQLKS